MRQIYARTAGALAIALAILLASGPAIADDDKRGSGKDHRGDQHDNRGSNKDHRGDQRDKHNDRYDNHRGKRDDDDRRWSRNDDDDDDDDDRRWSRNDDDDDDDDDRRWSRNDDDDDDDDDRRWSRNDGDDDDHDDRRWSRHDGDDDRRWSRNRDGRYQFDDRHRVFVRDYFVASGCPPGLANKGNHCVPPGQTRAWRIGRKLPPNLIYHDIPQPLALQFGQPPAGYRYVRIASDILLMGTDTGLIMDAIQNLGGR